MFEAFKGSQLLSKDYPGELFTALPYITDDLRHLNVVRGVQRSHSDDVLYDVDPYKVVFDIAEVGRKLDVTLRWRVTPRMDALLSAHRIALEGRRTESSPGWLPMYIGRLGSAGVVMVADGDVLNGHQATEEQALAVDGLFGALAHFAQLAVDSAPEQ